MAELIALGKESLTHHLIFGVAMIRSEVASSCYDVRISQVDVGKFSVRRFIVDVSSCHRSQASQVVSIQVAGYRELGVFVEMIAHQFTQFSCFLQFYGV